MKRNAKISSCYKMIFSLWFLFRDDFLYQLFAFLIRWTNILRFLYLFFIYILYLLFSFLFFLMVHFFFVSFLHKVCVFLFYFHFYFIFLSFLFLFIFHFYFYFYLITILFLFFSYFFDKAPWTPKLKNMTDCSHFDSNGIEDHPDDGPIDFGVWDKNF